MRVGIIGLGNMGGRIAKRLLTEGFEVGLFDVNETAVSQLVEMGGKSFSTPGELAEEFQYIITILPNVSIVKETLLGESGLLNRLTEKSLLIEMTSSEPSVTKELNDIMTANHLRMIDAPVSGGIQKAENGSLAIMVGGKAEDVQEVYPLLQSIGENITHVGEVGSGHTMKALNNLISATTLAATGEALALGVKLGLDPNRMLDVVNSSTGRSFSSEYKLPKQVLTREFEVGFTLDLMVKDLKIALGMAEEQKVPMMITGASYQLWKQAWSKGRGPRDHTEIIQHIEEMIDIEIKG
ncbi:NAD(P)-dependent oxidoreductase [Halobacillus sp. Marseille-P3879]|uniref:NAD(P)-dependent oxidoreductase n=1 Tax=Halobacillus sp. Marseille-P3879 TaxID=2045014 RepID=UPI000C7E8114|nr:NAD(P)-dependent oxidoreductase [Halobacillus sp. Marseille-P3879]